MARFVKILLSLPFLIAASVLGLYALGGFVVAPWWIKRELPQLLQTHLSATGSLGDIAINPFKLTLDARNFQMTEAGGTTPAIAFDRLFVDFEAMSLFKRAWTFADITIERPRVNLEIDAKDTLNLGKLAPQKPVPPKPETANEKSAPPRLLLEKFALRQGVVAFTDKGLSPPPTAKLEPIEFELHDLSTLPDHNGEYTLAARLPAGGTLGWRGTIALAPVASVGQIELKAVKLATLWQFVQDRLRIDEPGGQTALALKYNARYTDNKPAATASDIGFRLSDVSVKQKGVAEPALTAGELALTGGTFDLAARKVQFAELALNKIVANTLLDADGKANWAQLTPPSDDKPAAEPESKPPAGAPWQVGISAVNASDVRLSVLDQGFVQPLAIDIARTGLRAGVQAAIGAETTLTVDNIAVEIEDIRVGEAGAKTPLISLAAANLSGGVFDLAQKRFAAEKLRLAKPTTAIVRDAKGVINLAAAFARKQVKPPEPSTFATEIGVVELADGEVSFQDRSLDPALALDLQNIRVVAKNITTTAKATIPFEAGWQIKQGGTFSAQGSVTPEQQRASVKLDVRGVSLMPGAPLLEKQTGFKLTSGAAYAAGQLEWNGQGNAAGIRYNGNAGLDNVRLADNAADAATRPASSLRAQGTVTTNPQRASLKVEARHIALTPFAPLLNKHAALNLASGTAHAAGQVEWNGQGKTPGVRYNGNAAVDELRLDLEKNSERLFAWKELVAEGIQVDSAGKAARIDDLRINAPAGKIAIAKDRSTNLSELARKPAAAEAGAPAAATGKPPAAAAPAADGKEAPFVVNVERIHVRNGELDFSDQSLVLPFGALIQEFSGTITGLSNQPGTRASLKLEGRVNEFGQAQASGTLNPLAPKAFTDITVLFRNVELPPMTPYSATFAGRRIASGKLSLDLQYKLNNSDLQGENKVLLEQFTLGERVESPTAINLPLDLAIALLTDSKGRIDLSVPVRGNVDHPEFAYGHLIWQAIRTVIVNIVTAPFRALASLFGGGAEKVDAIAFEAGRAQLPPPEREKLARVAGVLKQRPQLRLGIEGRYDTTHDGAALRLAATRRTLAARQGIKLADNDDAALVNFDNAKTQRAIEALLEERAGADSIDKFKASHEKATGKPVSRVNAALALIGRGSPDRQFYEAMFNQVATLQPLDKDAFAALAAQRAAAVADYLKTSASVDAARVGTKPSAEVKADKAAEITTALSLDAGK